MAKKTAEGMGVGVFQVLTDCTVGDPAIVAKQAEDHGFASYWVPEHASIPEGSCDEYPGKAAGDAAPDYLFAMPDPFIALTRAASLTTEIRLGTGIALVPERNPILTLQPRTGHLRDWRGLERTGMYPDGWGLRSPLGANEGLRPGDESAMDG